MKQSLNIQKIITFLNKIGIIYIFLSIFSMVGSFIHFFVFYIFLSILFLLISFCIFWAINKLNCIFIFFRKRIFILNVKILFYGISGLLIFLFKPKGQDEILVKNLAIKKIIKKASPSFLIVLISYFVFFFLFNFFFLGLLSSSNGNLALAKEVTVISRTNKNLTILEELKKDQVFWKKQRAFMEKRGWLNDDFSWTSFFRSIYNFFFGVNVRNNSGNYYIKQHHKKIGFLPMNSFKDLQSLNFSDLRKVCRYMSNDTYFDLICQSFTSNIKKYILIADDPFISLDSYFFNIYRCSFKEYVSYFYEHKNNRSNFIELLESDIIKCLRQPGIKINLEPYEIFWKKFLFFHEINRNALLRLENFENHLTGRGISEIPYKPKTFPFIAECKKEITADMFLMEDNKKLRLFDKAKIQEILLINENLLILSKLSYQYFEGYNKF